MAARTGNLAWRVHFQGLDRNTRIKTGSTVVFDEEGNRLSVPLTMGTDVTYIDNLSGSHPNDSQIDYQYRLHQFPSLTEHLIYFLPQDRKRL